MPDKRLARARTTLPAGYQHGDAPRTAASVELWTAPHENAAERLERYQREWNVIEGERQEFERR